MMMLTMMTRIDDDDDVKSIRSRVELKKMSLM